VTTRGDRRTCAYRRALLARITTNLYVRRTIRRRRPRNRRLPGLLAVVPEPTRARPRRDAHGGADAGRPRDGEPVRLVGNGSHVDPIAEKLALGYPARDALATPLLALDFEKDDYDTPRIAGVVGSDAATIGVVRRDALLVEAVDEPTIVATYETDSPEPYALAAAEAAPPDAAAAASEVLGADFEHPVCAAGATVDEGGVTLAFDNDAE
jgi:IMP cyclohydrolase